MAVIDALPLMIFVKDAAALRFTLMNAAGERLLGRGRSELIGRTDHDFFDREQADFFQAKDRETLSAEGPVDVREEPISTPAGVRWLRTLKMAVRDGSGVARHLLGISEDITEKRELEHKLRHAQKMDEIGKLVAGIAHDFNNVLAVILSAAELAIDDAPKGDSVRESLLEIVIAGKRGADLTGQLLSFTRSPAHLQRSVDVNEVIVRMERMLRRTLEEHVQLTTTLGARDATVWADPTTLEQIVMNLAVNARDAMPNGGTLTLETSNVDLDDTFLQGHPGANAGPHILVAFSDTGTGMDEATLSRVFEPFFTTKPPGSGTGLGLWNVYGIVHQMGGTVWIYSEVGMGTTVKVYLPRTSSSEADPERNGPLFHPGRRGTETILVVEDDEQLLRLVSAVLRRNGYSVLRAQSPAEALLLVELHQGVIDLLLTDVIMPLLDGQKLAERLRHARPEMRVMFMSAYPEAVISRRKMLAPGSVVLQKPFAASTLLERIRDVLGSGALA